MGLTLSSLQRKWLECDVPLLRSGDHLSQKEFHRRYEAYPDDTRFELIDGVVYMMSPVGWDHGQGDFKLAGVMLLYEASTPAVEGAQNTSVILGDDDQPQPDICVMVRPEYGGKCRIEGKDTKYIVGAPELMVEVAHSSVSLDLIEKRPTYARAGTLEYIVFDVAANVVYWFDLIRDKQLKLPEDHILRSLVFPGLWIDTRALIKRNAAALVKCMNRGIATPEHSLYVERMEKLQLNAGTIPRASSSTNPLKRSRTNHKKKKG